MSLSKKRTLSILLVSMLICIGIGVKAQQEDMQEVVSWMYENGLTIYSTQQTFKPANQIRRDETAKLITIFAKNILSQEGNQDNSCYGFTDVSSQNTMKTYVFQVCELGYMKGSNRKFNPTGNLTNQQAIAIIIRMIEGWLDEPKSDWSKNYYTRAEEIGLLDGLNLYEKSTPISRGKFATLLYRLGTNEEINNSFDLLGSGLEMIGEAMIGMFGLVINSHTGLTTTFITQANTCTSGANNTTQTDFDMMGMNFFVKGYREIRGWEGEKCKVYERIEDYRVNISTGMIQSLIASGTTQQEINERIAEMESSLVEVIGKDGICKYSTGELVNMLQSELSGLSLSSLGESSSTNDEKQCTGTLYDQDN